ncbi:unnamed protein product, partial [Pelagomonas calceolata]
LASTPPTRRDLEQCLTPQTGRRVGTASHDGAAAAAARGPRVGVAVGVAVDGHERVRGLAREDAFLDGRRRRRGVVLAPRREARQLRLPQCLARLGSRQVARELLARGVRHFSLRAGGLDAVDDAFCGECCASEARARLPRPLATRAGVERSFSPRGARRGQPYGSPCVRFMGL